MSVRFFNENGDELQPDDVEAGVTIIETRWTPAIQELRVWVEGGAPEADPLEERVAALEDETAALVGRLNRVASAWSFNA